jgi:zinc transport system permease protein
MAGVILVLSLLTIPPNIAMIFTRVYFKIVIWSVLAGFLGTATGYAISYFAGVPVGATIIFTLVILWLIVKGINHLVKKISHSVRREVSDETAVILSEAMNPEPSGRKQN